MTKNLWALALGMLAGSPLWLIPATFGWKSTTGQVLFVVYAAFLILVMILVSAYAIYTIIRVGKSGKR